MTRRAAPGTSKRMTAARADKQRTATPVAVSASVAADLQDRSVDVAVVRLPHAIGLALPAYQTPGAAGLDLQAAVGEHAPLHLAQGARVLVPTGLAVALPAGFEAQIRPRSGLALKHGVTVLNAPGTIDADYRGEIQVILANFGDEPFVIRRGDRIAQMVIAPVIQATLVEVAELPATGRGTNGFGSTGRST